MAGNSEEVLMNVEHDWAKAVVDRDTLFVDRILSDDFVGWGYEGKRYTKADSKQDLRSGQWATSAQAGQSGKVNTRAKIIPDNSDGS